MLIGHMRRTMREDEAGQALVLGALTMLVLALSVMVTVQLGWTINRRIQLQNAADNSAFSTSAAVARCMNFIAWMNRTSVAHYVSMMAFQSYASFFTGVQTIMFLFADLVQQIAAMACVIEKAAAALKNLPYVGAIFAAIEIAFKIIRVACENGAKVLYGIVKSTWEAVDLLDKACAAAIQAISWLNQNAMWLLAKAIKEGMLAMLAVDALGGFQDRILQETACRDGSNCVNTGGTGTAYKGVMAAVNAAFSYRNIFDRYGSEAIPDGGTEARGDGYEVNDSVQNAERLMAELANGSRAGDGHAHGGIVTETFRGFNKESAGGLGSVAEYIDFKFQGSTRLTGSMDCSTFHEGTGKCDGQSASTAVEPPRPDTGRCDSLGKQCDKETKEAEEAQEECDSANAACSASGDPNSEACTDAIDKCDKAAGKREDAEDTCDRAEDACDPGTGIIGGGGVDGSNGKKNYVFEVGEDTSVTTRGSVIASADYVKASGLTLFTGAGGRMTGIQTNSNEDHSFHCRFKGGNDEGGHSDESQDGPRHKLFPNLGGCPKFVWTSDMFCLKEDHRHNWHGISRYVSFKPNPDKTKSFNQPSFVVLANMTPDKARMPADLAFGFDSSGEFKWTNWKEADMEGANKPGMPSLMPGLNAWSVAQVYYHRPGSWAEPPNLFNPFWRAKLAPVSLKTGEFLGRFSLGELGDILGLVLTH